MVGFINRTRDVKALEARLGNIQERVPLGKRLYNLYGPTGIGKTALLAYFINEKFGCIPSESQQRQLVTVYLREQVGVKAIWFDLNAFSASSSYEKTQQEFLGHLHEAVKLLLDQDYLQQLTDDHGCDQQLERIAETLRNYATEHPLLLCFDHCDGMDEALFVWLERRLLLPLTNDRSDQPAWVLGLFASQLMLRWRQFTVRQQVEAQLLDALDAQATLEQVKLAFSRSPASTDPADPSSHQDSLQLLATAIYQLSFGLPWATSIMLERLRIKPAKHTTLDCLDKAQITQISALVHEDEYKQSLIREVTQQITSKIASQIRSIKQRTDESPEGWIGWKILEAMSLLREFDVHSMRSMLKHYDATSFDNPSQALLLAYLRDLIETRLVIWVSEIRAYQVVTPIRQIFARKLELCDFQHYRAVREAAVLFYRDQIKTVMSYRHRYIIEYLFQTVSLPDSTPAEHRAELKDQFKLFLKQYYTDSEERDQLQSALEKDHEVQALLATKLDSDDPLRRIVQEFQSLHPTTNAL